MSSSSALISCYDTLATFYSVELEPQAESVIAESLVHRDMMDIDIIPVDLTTLQSWAEGSDVYPNFPAVGNATQEERAGYNLPQTGKRKGKNIDTERNDTSLTRKLFSCLRCRMQKIRCHIDPRNPGGSCHPCMNIQGRLASLPSKDPPANILQLSQSTYALNQYIAESSIDYVKAFMKDENPITRAVFSLACSQRDGAGKSLIQGAIRLWTVTRLTEGGDVSQDLASQKPTTMACDSDTMMDDTDGTDCSQILDKEIQSLMTKSRKKLQELHQCGRRGNWLALFITSYILLHNLEAIIQRERNYARHIQSHCYYTDIAIINSCLRSAQIILAYFHYSNKGHPLFEANNPELGYSSLAEFSTRERAFVTFLVGELEAKIRLFHLISWAALLTYKEDKIVAVSSTHEYDQEFWLTGQLFDREWKPRVTLETPLPST